MKELFYTAVGNDNQKFDLRKFLGFVSFWLGCIDYTLQMCGIVPENNERITIAFTFSGSMKVAYHFNKKMTNGFNSH